MSKRVSGIFKGDKVIWMVFFFLCIISAIEVFSALSSLTFKTGDYVSPMIKHIGLLLLGVFFMIVTLNIPCRYFKLATPFLIIGCFIALVWVHFFGQSINGAGRWMSILGIKFQPSEIAKGTMMLATAQILSAMQTDHGADRHAFFYILTIWAILVPLIFLENLSTAVLLSMTVFFMMIIGRVPAKQLLRTVGFIAVVIAISISLVFAIGDDRNADNGNKAYTEMVARNGKVVEKKQQKSMFPRADTWKARIKKFGNNEYVPPEKVDLDKDAQTSYANIAIASSNFIGKGPGNSEERDFLPQAYSDYIYAILIEETGLFGAFFVAMLYVILLYRVGIIANRCENNFPAFLVMGLGLMIVIQALFNMCVAVGLVPVTGQPLPLISRGGTSTVINCVYIGMILSVSRTAKKNKVGAAKNTIAAATTPQTVDQTADNIERK